MKLIRYRSTRRYFRTYIYTEILCILYLSYKAYPYLTDLLLVLQSLFWYFGSYPSISEHFRILYMYYKTYTCISDLTCILQNLYLSYGTYTCVQDLFLSYRSYTCVTKLILVFQILFFCEGTRRYDKSEHIRIISHIG